MTTIGGKVIITLTLNELLAVLQKMGGNPNTSYIVIFASPVIMVADTSRNAARDPRISSRQAQGWLAP